MLRESFVGTIADNSVEVGWILCFSLLADKLFVEKITSVMALNDLFWMVLSCSYYTVRTSMVATLPKYVAQQGKKVESKYLKNAFYLIYLMLLPIGVISYLNMESLLSLLGVNSVDMSYYLPYFKLSVVAIVCCAPFSLMFTSWLRTRGETKTAMLLDHSIAWSMLGGIFFTTHILNQGVLVALAVNMFSNSIPLFWFLYKQPIKKFWASGFEFSPSILKEYWELTKWELVRRLSPRVSGLIGGLIASANPLYLGAKYWISTLATYLEGWVDAVAGTLNVHVSRNVGLGYKDKDIYKDNNKVFSVSLIYLSASLIILYVAAFFLLRLFLPESLYSLILNPLIYIFLWIEIATKMRYYTLISITRAYRTDLNHITQLAYAIPTIVLSPLLLYIFIFLPHWDFVAIFSIGAIVSSVQWLFTEIYLKKKLFSAI